MRIGENSSVLAAADSAISALRFALEALTVYELPRPSVNSPPPRPFPFALRRPAECKALTCVQRFRFRRSDCRKVFLCILYFLMYNKREFFKYADIVHW